jgi:uncharacterized protein (DUF736 family)
MTARTAHTPDLVNGFGWQRTATPLAPLLQRLARIFFPCVSHAFLAEPRNVGLHHPPLRSSLLGAADASPCLKPAIETANERGVRPTRRKLIMANIGSFKKSGENGYTGEIVTMSLQKKNVTIVAEEASENENAPSHRVIISKADVGACWQKTSKEGRDYLSIKLDDPSFNAPIFASLFADEDGKTFNLIWSRARTSNGN